MLIPPDRFEMSVTYQRKISVEFRDIFEHITSNHLGKRLVFIDPMVLGNQDSFLSEETCGRNIILIPTNLTEANKDLESLTAILELLQYYGVGRRGDTVYAVGGGVLIDCVAFACSVYRRGIAMVKVPSTLLGIVDAAIGIKTGVNFRGQRNRIGSYHFDYNVIISPKLMEGLQSVHLRQGLGELFKIAIIKSRCLFDLLEQNRSSLENVGFYSTSIGLKTLKLGIELMLDELRDNPREDNLKRCVDFGHSFSPLVEMESIRRDTSRSIPHGFAVAFDCLLSTTIAFRRGLMPEPDYLAAFNLFMCFDFDLCNEIYNDYNLLWCSFLEMTRHRGGAQNLPVPTGIGQHCFVQNLSFDEMRDSLVDLQYRITQCVTS